MWRSERLGRIIGQSTENLHQKANLVLLTVDSIHRSKVKTHDHDSVVIARGSGVHYNLQRSPHVRVHYRLLSVDRVERLGLSHVQTQLLSAVQSRNSPHVLLNDVAGINETRRTLKR